MNEEQLFLLKELSLHCSGLSDFVFFSTVMQKIVVATNKLERLPRTSFPNNGTCAMILSSRNFLKNKGTPR